MSKKQLTKEQELRQEVESWKETCEIVSDKDVMSSIQKSLRQIACGEGISLSQL